MSNGTLELPDADVAGSPAGAIRPTDVRVDEHDPAPAVAPVGRRGDVLIAQHPELATNLLLSLNPAPPPLARDVGLFQTALADIRRAAADGILTAGEANTLIVAVVESFAARQATQAMVTAVRSALALTSG